MPTGFQQTWARFIGPPQFLMQHRDAIFGALLQIKEKGVTYLNHRFTLKVYVEEKILTYSTLLLPKTVENPHCVKRMESETLLKRF